MQRITRRVEEANRLIIRGGLGLANDKLATFINDEGVGHCAPGINRQDARTVPHAVAHAVRSFAHRAGYATQEGGDIWYYGGNPSTMDD